MRKNFKMKNMFATLLGGMEIPDQSHPDIPASFWLRDYDYPMPGSMSASIHLKLHNDTPTLGIYLDEGDDYQYRIDLRTGRLTMLRPDNDEEVELIGENTWRKYLSAMRNE